MQKIKHARVIWFEFANPHSTMKKINAFTIIELLVAMAIAGIVVSLSVMMYLQFQRYIYKFSEDLDANNSVSFLASAMQRDFDRSPIVSADREFIKTTGAKDNITYEFYRQMIIRSGENKSDTFNVGYNDLSIEYLDLDKTIIRSVFFTVPIDKQLNYPVYIYKDYPAQVLFELDVTHQLNKEE